MNLTDEEATTIKKEFEAIKARLKRTNCTENDRYWHPAAAEQYGGTQEELDKAQRVKAKVIVDTRFGFRHCSGLYLPPGELVTIEIPEAAKDKIWLSVNFQSMTYELWGPGNKKRLYGVGFDDGLKLDRNVNTVVWPYGGYMAFEITPDTFGEPVEIIVSGGILTPWFRYGVDTDEDWERIKTYPGLTAVFETGNIQLVMPAINVRSLTGPSLAMRFFRSCAQVMESTVTKSNWGENQGPRPNGRERVPNYWFFDEYVPAGAAVAFVYKDFSRLPLYWIEEATIGSMAMNNCWGHLHEMGHHHQEGWGIGDTGEVTNNCLVVICYSYYSLISSFRYEKGDGEMGFGTGAEWSGTTHQYTITFGGGSLNQWCSLIHGFGAKKMREFVKADRQDLYYGKQEYGNVIAWALRGAKIFGYDLRPHLQFNGFDIYNNSAFNQTKLALIDEMNVKPWYPVANMYQTGYEMNGSVFETARPFKLKWGQTKVFNFTQYEVTPESGHIYHW